MIKFEHTIEEIPSKLKLIVDGNVPANIGVTYFQEKGIAYLRLSYSDFHLEDGITFQGFLFNESAKGGE